MTEAKKRAPRATTKTATDAVLAEVKAERQAQDARWGEQNHPLIGGAFIGSRRRQYADEAVMWKRMNEYRVATNTMGWDSIAGEELFEALEATTLEAAREEYVQLAAVAVAAVQSIDRKLAARNAA